MACLGQATFIGTEIIIECKDKWSCCQRAQAQAKVKAQNKAIKAAPGKSLSPVDFVSDDVKNAKEQCCNDAWKEMKADLDADAKKGAQKHCTHECQHEPFAKDYKDNGPYDNRSDIRPKIELDHPVECKIGGAAKQTLTILDKKVNGHFGRRYKTVADDMLDKDPNAKIEKVSLVCPGPCDPPHDPADKNFSEGDRSDFPADSQITSVTPRRTLGS